MMHEFSFGSYLSPVMQFVEIKALSVGISLFLFCGKCTTRHTQKNARKEKGTFEVSKWKTSSHIAVVFPYL
jgi:hypothetical protein